jgi:hypothetical protein
MYPEEWERLEQLAKETNSRPRHGTTAHQVTWPALIRRIAIGELHVVDPKPYVIPPALDEACAAMEAAEARAVIEAAAAKLEQEQAEQQRLAQQRQKLHEHAEQKAAARKTPAVKLAQLDMFPEPA